MLILEAGSTKTTWMHVSSRGNHTYTTAGFNPVVHQPQEFEFIDGLNFSTIRNVYYYGTGIINEESGSLVASILGSRITQSKIEINDDLIGAARGTLGNNAGGIGILGTGSNSAFYDGKDLHKNTPALGYILGDEGGGVDIGKRIIRDFFYHKMPDEIRVLFLDKYELERPAFLGELKDNPFPNRYLAGFASFLSEIEGSWKKNLLLNSFSSFFEIRKKDFKQNDCNCFVGSIAYAFEDLLKEAGEKYNIKISKITKAPIEGLVKYHIEKNYGEGD